ncbi:hypothetical protein AAZX31_20G075100 [Glycine max]|uniref:Uncharacterized protein n=2 Tax=Glycine subgen. Soja TaxID=1462606 RepID=I1NEN0_SOYBN|nr:uncharacterized protein LOC100777782 [Glycine max]XP_028220380.1 uncharacterized protein LOC114402031 [Glycine soja]KAG4907170.1 hypothetical protein JHK86_055654 [Glycine max]KAG4918380.1 hypothetical protein JHK85_056661 [Glycine max]KAG5074468.1 hypothetical protein JHK84_055699 [Glycine max]KAG5077138.1 hypothetical protein JHK82_055833 [Glycine max]KAH1035154.1 hypothetical protein GYH30_055226 [Glycine max]|eukprot:XP_014627776.1 uncharacterized protein LOC100777782 isoform X1 [Glycine max]
MEEEQTHIMKDSDDMESQEEEEEEREEALSLCDLPLNRNSRTPSLDDMSFKKILRPSSLPDHAGEIFNGFSSSSSSDMCPADDIIFCGKLVPFKAEQPLKNLIAAEEEKSPARRRRSESLSSVTRSNSVSTFTGSRHLMMRNSKSLDYSRLRESAAPEVDRNSSSRSVVPPEAAVKKATKPRWYSLMFGTMKIPPEMELSDMKNRQVRRNPSSTMFLTADSGGKMAVNRSHGKVSWRILKALSCKDHSSVAVTTSFPLPQAS